MMYLDGGAKASIRTLANNVRGLAYYIPSYLSVQLGIQGKVGLILRSTLQYAYTMVAVTVGRTAAIVGGVIAGIVAATGATAAAVYLSKHRVFY